MNLMDSMGLHAEARLYLLNVIIALTLIAGLGLLAQALLRRKHKALCAGVLGTTLVLIVVAPFLPALANIIGMPGWTMTWGLMDPADGAEATPRPQRWHWKTVLPTSRTSEQTCCLPSP